MDKNQVLETIKLVKEHSPKKKFNQTLDMIVNLKNLNLKNPNENMDLFITVPHKIKKPKICAIVGRELETSAKIFDKVVNIEELEVLKKDQKEVKRLSNQFDFFIAQANLMAGIATAFGKILGPRGKMPNPKAGGVVLPNSDLGQVKEKFNSLVQVKTRKELVIKTPVGKENMKDENILENTMLIYNALIHALPQEEANVSNVILKLTMGPAIKVGSKKEDVLAKIASEKPVAKSGKKESPEKKEKITKEQKE